MALEDLTTFDQLIIRIVEKKDFGRQAITNEDEGVTPKLNERFDTQREKVRDQTKIAEFKFPINFEGRTFYYQQYSATNTYRQNTENGLTGIVSEMCNPGGRSLEFKDGSKIQLSDCCQHCDHEKLKGFLLTTVADDAKRRRI